MAEQERQFRENQERQLREQQLREEEEKRRQEEVILYTVRNINRHPGSEIEESY